MLARLPLSMSGIALLLLVVEATDSYALGGAVQATWIIVEATVAPLAARLVDRHGQLLVVGPQTVVNVVASALLIAVVVVRWPIFTWFVTAAVAGAALPVIGSLVRARWGYLLRRQALLRTAYSWESVVDESVFVLGPPAATLMSVALGPAPALAVTIAIGAIGTAALLVQRGSEPPHAGHAHVAGQGSALGVPGMPVLFCVMLLLGAVFAGVEVTVIATARESGETATAGVVLAVWSASSLVTGLVVGSLRRAPALVTQLTAGSAALSLFLLPLLFTNDLPVVTVVLLLAGVGVSPSLIAGYALVERLVPAARLTEGLTWVTTGLSLGFALGSPATGAVVDGFGPPAGFWVGVLAAVLACGLVLWRRSALTTSGE